MSDNDDCIYEIDDRQRAFYNAMTVMQQEICMSFICTPGMTWVEAYKTSSLGTSTNYSSISMQASHIQRNKNVQAFLKCIREDDFDERIIGRQEALQILSRQARGKITDNMEFKSHYVGMCPKGGGPLWQTKWGLKHVDDLDLELLANISEISEGKEGTKVKTYSSRDAIKDISRMQGWDSATQYEHKIKGGEGKDGEDTIPLIRVSFVEGKKKPNG